LKTRLDIYLTEHSLVTGREKAKAIIMEGIVYVNDQKADKPGMPVSDSDIVEVRGDTLPYVSRGGLKLEKAMNTFGISLESRVCMDIGASTGGFTDCMLQNGAKSVYSVDVGYGQLAWKLRTDERVHNMERTNIRFVTTDSIGGAVLDFCSIDVSFISLTLVLPVAYKLLSDSGEAVCLIKPQFEAGREKVGKNGVVREKSTHIEVIEKVISFAEDIGFGVLGLDFSPIKGPKGNIEYLAYLKKGAESCEYAVSDIVDKAHGEAR